MNTQRAELQKLVNEHDEQRKLVNGFRNKISQKLGYKNFEYFYQTFKNNNDVVINCFNKTPTFEILVSNEKMLTIHKLFGYPNLDVMFNTWKTLLNVKCYRSAICIKFKFSLN